MRRRRPPRPLTVGVEVSVRRVPAGDPWLARLVGQRGVVIERGLHYARGYLRPPAFVVLRVGGEEVTLLESECEPVEA